MSFTVLCLLPVLITSTPAKGLTAAPGFDVTEFADSTLANDITCMTLDPTGRVVVAGRGYIRLLIDRDGNGRADQAIDVVRDVKDHAMGLMWEGDSLYAVVDGGLWRWRIGKDGATAEGARERLAALRTTSEHHAHAIKRGPDGWLYLMAGDSTGIDGRFASLPTSPIRNPVGGCLVRFSPDLTHSEIVADGFRNAYDFDFDPQGFAWTFDSDNERCVSLPWTEPTRIYRIMPGRRHGWRAPQQSETWRCPPYFPDIVAPTATVGRGSPTGVVYHKHTAWPARLRGVFVADWTFGRIWRFRPGFMEKPEPFLVSTGDHGFAPTAMAVHPKTGDLFVSIGGRGTRGAVFRVHWNDNGSFDRLDFEERGETVIDPITQAVSQRLKPASPLVPRIEFGVEWKDEFASSIPQRAQRARNSDELARILVELKRHRDRFPPSVLMEASTRAVRHNSSMVFLACADLIAALPPEDIAQVRSRARTPEDWLLIGYAVRDKDPAVALDMALRVFELDRANRQRRDPALRLEVRLRMLAVRLIQLALGDLTAREFRASVWAGYSPSSALPNDRYPRARQAVRDAYPSDDPQLDRELTRTLAVLEDDNAALFTTIVAKLTHESDPLDDVHHLIVLSRLRAPRTPGATRAIAGALLDLDRKIVTLKRNRDRNFPLRIAELHFELSVKDALLNDAILSDAGFGRPDHALFARCRGFDRSAAATKFMKRAESDADFRWDSELVGLLGELPVQSRRTLLRRLADRGGLNDAVLPLLAKSAEPEDVARLLAGVTSPRLDIVRACLTAIARVAPGKDAATLLALIRCLRLLPEGKEGDRLREMTGRLLETVSGEKFGSDRETWTAWLAKAHPELAAKLGGADGVDVAGWRRRLAGLDWNAGESDRGKEVFTRANCAACHSGGQAMGPDLHGAAGRFSRDDLFTAIIQPSKDVPSRYRMTQIETTDGRTYQGLIVYEAVDGLILQTGPAETVRIAGDRIDSRRLSENSLMPAGLLDKLNDRDLADLYAFLKSLIAPR